MTERPNMTRREFLQGAAGIAGMAALGPASYARVLGSNEDIRVAVVGFGGRGGSHISAFSNMKGVRVVALCDCDSDVLAKGLAGLKARGIEAKGYADLRELISSPDVDVITTATPNHWHSLITVWACQAGKDVYVEKPVSHNIFEGRQAVRAARKHGRIVQTGTQGRSDARWREAWAWLAEGHIGKVTISRGLCYKRRASIGKVDGPQPIPPAVNYDLWCGPAEKLPLMRRELHYDWHWVWNTGNGDLGNQGIHQMDVARWALGRMELAPTVMSIGGRLGYVDDGETANTQMVVFDYGAQKLIFEVRGLPQKSGSGTMDRYREQSIGNTVECEGGYIAGAKAYDSQGKVIKEFTGEGFRGGDHFANFIDAVRSRKVADLNADILEGHLSSALCHQGNISYRLGQQADPEELRAAVQKDADAQETLARMEEHLAANGIDIKAKRLTAGPRLRFDPRRETFVGNREADALTTRVYRDGFVVPERI
ncbi:MAG: Gfo/Idh/MocA family oxidoreductase [Chthonomonadales bacterium]|nr:Gfo/Idh/MocA family oxidoreductase [Chthonomonadales bacterium]